MNSATLPYFRLRFQTLASEASPDLFEVCLSIAGEEYPELDVPRYRGRMRELASGARRSVAGELEPAAIIQKVNHHLFEEEGFHGNEDDYYAPENSLINQVLDRRTGIPITLSIVYMEVCRAASLPMVGIGLPGHFVVRTLGADPPLYVDPFHGGAILSADECRQMALRYTGKDGSVEPYLAPLPPLRIVARVLTNLKGAYLRAHADGKVAAAIERLLLIEPDNGHEVRDLGLVYLRMACLTMAYGRLRRYVNAFPDADDAAEIARHLPGIRALAFPEDRYLAIAQDRGNRRRRGGQS